MTIKVTCRCRAQLKAKDELAGRRVKCPKCGELLTVPQPEPTAKAAPTPKATAPQSEESYELAPEPTPVAKKHACPFCQAVLPPGAVLCVQCGFHLVQGKHLTTTKAMSGDDSSVPETAVGKCVCRSCKYYKPVRAGVCVWCGFHVSLEAKIPLNEIARHCGVKDLVTARARVRAQRNSKTCPSCGAKTEVPGALCPQCDALEADVLEQQRLNVAYVEYRQATVTRLTRMWEDIRAMPAKDESRLRALLVRWPQEFASCEPPKELLTVQGHRDNLQTLQFLAEGARCVAAVTAADLSTEAWPNCRKVAAQRATDRVAMLCRLAKGMGKDLRQTNEVVICLDRDHTTFDDWLSEHPEKLGPLDDSPEMIEEKLREQLSMELTKRGISSFVSSKTAYGERPRKLHVQVHNWRAKQTRFQGPISLESKATVRYTDEEPDPGYESARPTVSSGGEVPEAIPGNANPSVAEILAAARAEKAGGPAPSQILVHINRQYDSYESDVIRCAWAAELVSKFPAAFNLAAAPTWAGIGITCPNCGHPDVLTERNVPAVKLCVRCGHDAITGEPESVREKAREVTKAEREAGVLGMLFSRKTREKQQALKDQLAAEKSEAASKFKHPEAVAENQRKIKALVDAATQS